jgi:hypothetical protein
MKLFEVEPRYVLLTYNEFVDWFIPKVSPRGDHSWDNITNIIDVIKLFISNGVCRNLIGSGYVKDTLDNLMDKDEFDLIIAVKADYLSIYNFETPDIKLQCVCGFLIAEKGECKRLPNTYSINLICTSPGTIKGYYLMGAFLSAVINTPDPTVEKRVILELAGSFTNLEGFYSYSKVGFTANPTLYGNDCFSVRTNLPMESDLVGITTNEVLGWVLGRSRAQIMDYTGLTALILNRDKTDPDHARQSILQQKLAQYWKNIYSAHKFNGRIKQANIAYTERMVNEINTGIP